METFELPEGFLIGTSTASLQIEGGDRNNNWYRWAEAGHIKDGTHCIVADDHWNRVDEDIDLMRAMHNNAYRMSIEWSRIEPAKGVFDDRALAHYRDEIEKLVTAGIRPLVTLHHFSHPLWLEDMGGWTNPEVIDLFERYTEYVVKGIGDLVPDWATINEPNVYLLGAYVALEMPPAKKSLAAYFKGAKNMIMAHIKAYRKIHAVREAMGKTDTMVGVANHLRVFEPKQGRAMEKWAAHNLDWVFQDIFLVGMTEGRLMFPVGRGYPLGKGRYFDFFGINYYSRDIIGFTLNPGALFAKMEVKEGAPVNDLGWEIYPEGLYRLCKKYYERFHMPIYITENGTCDAKDAFRTRYVYDHLLQVSKLINDGIDVRGYYHWTLMDNFEWTSGLTPRFGLVEVDYSTLARKIRRSGEFYGEICQNHGATEEMLARYL